MDPIAVAFPLAPSTLDNGLKRGDNSFAMASLPDSKQQFKGKLQFIDNVGCRLRDRESQGCVWPGAFANVELEVTTLNDVIVIPKDGVIALTRAASLWSMLKVKAAQKKIEVKYTLGLDAVVAGIEEGTKIVLEGKQNLRPGTPVKERADEPTEGKGKKAGKGGEKAGAEPASASAARKQNDRTCKTKQVAPPPQLPQRVHHEFVGVVYSSSSYDDFAESIRCRRGYFGVSIHPHRGVAWEL